MGNSLVILLALLVIIAGVTYLLIERRQEQAKADNQPEDRTWPVQCPQCSRWKELSPHASDHGEFMLEDGKPALQSGGRYRFHNAYKCPFCGHRWEEEYLE